MEARRTGSRVHALDRECPAEEGRGVSRRPGRPRSGSTLGAATLLTLAPLMALLTGGFAWGGVFRSAAAVRDGERQGGSQLGYSVAGAGDVNGDGFADVIVGAPYFDAQASNEGRAYLYLGSPAGLAAAPAWTADPTDELGALFGWSVAGAGDVNGDGYADVLVSAVGYGPSFASEGRVYLYLGGLGGLASTPAWWADPTDQTGAGFGGSVAGVGDVNGDGLDDVVIGASLYDGDAGNEGRAYLYLARGFPSWLGDTPAWVSASAGLSSARVGDSVSPAGDFDGDGRKDFAYTAALGTGGLAQLSVVTWDSGSPPTAWVFMDSSPPSALALLGDVNGDGLSDLALGSATFSAQANFEGAVFLYHGRARDGGAIPDAGGSEASWSVHPTDRNGSRFGAAVAGAGDVNGDGFPDLLVGAPEYGETPATAYEGRAYLFLGNGAGFDTTPAWVADPVDQEFSKYGSSVAGAGDIDGDGFADVVAGAPEYDGAQTKQGRFFVYFGTGVPRPPDGGSGDGGLSDGGVGVGVGVGGDGGGLAADGGEPPGPDAGTRRVEVLKLGCDCTSATGTSVAAGSLLVLGSCLGRRRLRRR